MKTPRLIASCIALFLGGGAVWLYVREAPQNPAGPGAITPGPQAPVLVSEGRLVHNPAGQIQDRTFVSRTRAATRAPGFGVTMDTLTAANSGLTLDARERFLNELSRGVLAEADRATLIRELRLPGAYPGLSEPATHALKNEMLNLLLSQPGYRAETTDLLLSLFQDRAQGAVMRDYALQHLSDWRTRQTEADAARTGQVESAFWQALEEKEGTIAVTALLALHRFGTDEEQPAPEKFLTSNRSRLEEATMQLAQNGSLPARVTATALCGQLGIKAALPGLETVAASSSEIPLRSAAFHALGQLAASGQPPTPATIALLQQSASGTDYRLRTAARAALALITP